MKLIRCTNCGQVIALWSSPLSCECKQSGGHYRPDGDHITIWGPCRVFGVNNILLYEQKTDAYPYPEDNGKVHRIERPKGRS